jgi:hypothetical protein
VKAITLQVPPKLWVASAYYRTFWGIFNSLPGSICPPRTSSFGVLKRHPARCLRGGMYPSLAHPPRLGA